MKYEIIKKNGKFFMKSNVFFGKGEAMIYGANTNEPYVRYAGYIAKLDDEMKKELKKIA